VADTGFVTDPDAHGDPIAGLTVCYDAECEVCRTAVARLRRMDHARALRLIPLQEVARELPELAAGRGPEAWGSALHVVEPDGRVTAGGEAILRIAETLPGLKPIARLGRLPLVRHLVEPLYRLMARHRHRLDRFLRNGRGGNG
jgi:predicted DCC family thiol-disulfide oxidoreductase YuxK